MPQQYAYDCGFGGVGVFTTMGFMVTRTAGGVICRLLWCVDGLKIFVHIFLLQPTTPHSLATPTTHTSHIQKFIDIELDLADSSHGGRSPSPISCHSTRRRPRLRVDSLSANLTTTTREWPRDRRHHCRKIQSRQVYHDQPPSVGPGVPRCFQKNAHWQLLERSEINIGSAQVSQRIRSQNLPYYLSSP